MGAGELRHCPRTSVLPFFLSDTLETNPAHGRTVNSLLFRCFEGRGRYDPDAQPHHGLPGGERGAPVPQVMNYRDK